MGLFVQYDSFDGSATAKGFEKYVQAKAVSAVSTRTGLTGQAGAQAQQRMTGTAQPGPIQVVQDLDKACPKILEAMLGGKLNKKIVVCETMTVGGEQATINKYTFEDCLFTLVRQESDSAGKSSVVVEFMPMKLEQEFTEYDAKDGAKKGNVNGKFDGSTQKAG